uniref:Phosphotransferase (EC) n=1 Tax=Ganoderma boninense TaxID=34458 RepID=A0A5K1JZG9_9APHY|nr:Phosphotransferase (EC [Ganoderma boninense]
MISPSGFERHPDLYFSDGDVVLAVKQTPKSEDEDEERQPKYQLFRVHKFMLKLHSPAFSNFFADADATPAEVYDGVSLAEMHGDKAEDFALLLSYLYKPSSFVFKRQSPHTPGIVSGVIRLADKYLMESLHRRLVQQVCDDWPTTLDDYDIDRAAIDVLEALPRRSVQDRIYPCGSARYPGEFVPEPISAIHFAREFGCPQILPAAFYRLSLTPAADYYEAFGFPQSHWPPTELARLATLDKETLLGYIHGCQMLAGYRPPVTRFMCDDCAEEWNLEQGPPLHSPCYQYITWLFVLTRPGSSGADKLGDRSQVHGDPLRWLWRCFDH